MIHAAKAIIFLAPFITGEMTWFLLYMKGYYGRSQHHRWTHVYGDRQFTRFPGPLSVLYNEGMSMFNFSLTCPLMDTFSIACKSASGVKGSGGSLTAQAAC